MKRIGKYVIETENSPKIESFASVVGKKESEGPLGEYFDQGYTDSYLGKKSWENAEAELQKQSVTLAIDKGGLKTSDIDLLFAGDLLNQCISSTFGNRDFNIPFLGQYGACSTMAQALLMASVMVDCGCATRAVAVTSSHFCTAERQFRLPLEYGGQRTPTAQWTATGSGALVVGQKGTVKISKVAVGKIVDLSVTDVANMGAAMAPAAADTILGFLSDTKTTPKDYDYIFTGDLGVIGSKLLAEIMENEGVNIHQTHRDCGVLLYDIDTQDVHGGGSGCGCSASVLCSYILKEMEKGKMKRILFCATGALMSTTSSQQGESIPGICHVVELITE